MKWIKRSLLLLFALAVLAALVYGFMPKPVPADTVQVARGALQVTVSEEGRTRVHDRFTVFAPLAGRIERINLRPGDTIAAGQRITGLAALAPAPLDARMRTQATAEIAAASAGVEQATAQVRAAAAEAAYLLKEVERLQRLLAGNNTSRDSVDSAVARKEAADANLQSATFAEAAARYRLQAANAALIEDATPGSITAISSPVSGVVLQVIRESEGPVTPGEPLVEVGDPQSIEVVTDLLSRDAVRVKPGMKADILRWGGTGSLKAVVRRVEPRGFTKISALGVEEQRVNVILDFAGERGGLGDGYRVEVRVILEESVNVLKVPAGAVFTTAEGAAVYVVEGGRARRQIIQAGRRSGLEVEVLDGLGEGTSVILFPPDAVKDGVAIAAR